MPTRHKTQFLLPQNCESSNRNLQSLSRDPQSETISIATHEITAGPDL